MFGVVVSSRNRHLDANGVGHLRAVVTIVGFEFGELWGFGIIVCESGRRNTVGGGHVGVCVRIRAGWLHRMRV